MDTLEMESKIMQVLRQVYDPEIPVNIYDLGLVYEIRVEEDGRAFVTMTLTSPNCPVAESLPVEVKESVLMVPGITSAEVTVTFNPPWNKDMMTEEAKLDLGLL
ncbi:MAG TPA: iron-sulfur cluster assembly protein [Bacteroidales bacterium]|nr:iron-sulfur cluster assembly protein [Bacteroidales bacterium]HRZ47956.1 iron-sulfur cluster assembly protein [Bacteroidales bacterium]